MCFMLNIKLFHPNQTDLTGDLKNIPETYAYSL